MHGECRPREGRHCMRDLIPSRSVLYGMSPVFVHRKSGLADGGGGGGGFFVFGLKGGLVELGAGGQQRVHEPYPADPPSVHMEKCSGMCLYKWVVRIRP